MSPTLPPGWGVWSNEDGGRLILAYRPDVFDAEAYPAPCLPTIYLTDGSDKRRPGAGQYSTSRWTVTLYLEPEVEASSIRYPDREAGVEGATAIAARFSAGDIDYRESYQVPRDAYLDELDELTGREEH